MLTRDSWKLAWGDGFEIVNQHLVSLIPNYISWNSSAKNDLYCIFNNVVNSKGSNYNEIEQKKEGARAVNPDNSSEDSSHYEPNHNYLNSLPQYEAHYISNPLKDRKKINKLTKGRAGVYVWVNSLNNKHYVGSSSKISTRISMYYMLSIISRASRTIETAFFKYGMINFTLTLYLLPVWCYW